ncbi:MAG: type II secretion system protein [Patescibacteria group bacterium]
MKKFLPASGFTLIELLVVIAILAILAVMGFAAFGGLAGRGNDGRRAADIKAFTDAMEVVRAKANASVYTAPAATDFAGGTFPKEPTSRTPKYCYLDSTTAAVANPTLASWGSATPTACPTNWANVDGVVPTVTANAIYFKFCTINEAGSTNTIAANAAVICQGSRQ